MSWIICVKNAILELLKVLKYCLKLSFQSSKKYTIIRILGKITVPLFTTIELFFTKKIIDLLVDSTNLKQIFFCIFGMFMINVLSIITIRLINHIESIHDEIIEYNLNTMIFNKTLDSDVELFDNPQHYNKLNFAIQNLGSVSAIIWRVMDIISAIITCITSIVMLSNISFTYFFMITLSILPVSIINWKYTKVFYELAKKQVDGLREKYYIFDLAVMKEYALDIRLFNFKNILKLKFNTIWKVLFKEKKENYEKHIKLSIILEIIPEIIIIIITIHIIYLVFNEKLTIGDYSLYTGLLIQFNSSLFQLTNHMMIIYDNKIKIESIIEYLLLNNRIEKDNGIVLKDIDKIEFKDVSFKYPHTSQYALKNISFKIEKGDRIAILGENGSGKSTFIKLLMRFYDVSNGSIFINDKNINCYSISSLRKCFTSYFQDSPNYSFTIRENIALGDWENRMDNNKIIEILKKINAENIIRNNIDYLDNDYSKLFNVEGVELSKGQQQKLALARTLFRKSKILILDEPSSSLDVNTEEKIFYYIKESKIYETIILITHRISMIGLADYIIVLEKGRIIESGNKRELLKKKGIFWKLYEFQENQKNKI